VAKSARDAGLGDRAHTLPAIPRFQSVPIDCLDASGRRYKGKYFAARPAAANAFTAWTLRPQEIVKRPHPNAPGKNIVCKHPLGESEMVPQNTLKNTSDIQGRRQIAVFV
jgi:hypothetical protein